MTKVRNSVLKACVVLCSATSLRSSLFINIACPVMLISGCWKENFYEFRLLSCHLTLAGYLRANLQLRVNIVFYMHVLSAWSHNTSSALLKNFCGVIPKQGEAGFILIVNNVCLSVFLSHFIPSLPFSPVLRQTWNQFVPWATLYCVYMVYTDDSKGFAFYNRTQMY